MGMGNNRIIPSALRFFYRWHRRLGIIAVLFIIILSVTGILLNHNADLDLNKTNISNAWLLKIYNIDNSNSEFGYPSETLTMDRVILDIHTGRFFGKFTPWIMDIIAIILLILSFSGIYIWAKRFFKRKK